MKLLLNLSFRNLMRQKRRNLLLGLAIAIGVAILTMAGSFSRGMSDVLFNKVVSYVAGHVSINVNEGYGKRVPVFRDREKLLSILEKYTEKTDEIDEATGVFVRAIGNGRAENMVLVGVDTTKSLTEEQVKEYEESFNVIDGKFEDLHEAPVKNAAIISKEMAKSLNVKKNDIISIRFRNIFGQSQSERLTIVGILSNDNIFMQGVLFCELTNVKSMMGYRPYECANMQIKIKDPQKNAIALADRIHAALKPGPAFIAGKISGREITVLPFRGDDDSIKLMRSSFKLVRGKMDDVLLKDGVMVSSRIASGLGIGPGSEIRISYDGKFEKEKAPFKVKVRGVFESNAENGTDTVYMHEALFYPRFYDRLPDLDKDRAKAFFPADSAAFKPALGTEWELLKRSRNTDEMRKKFAADVKKKIRATTVDVNSMYESASDVLKLESVLNMITLIAVLILFFIILIGVVNTLRMTIKERTREIGTIRAIGMQKRDVWGIFMLETTMLSLFASIAGTIIAFILMGLLSLITFNVTDNPLGILLVSKHLYFLPTFGNVISNIILILVLTVITAFFPARRAANLSSAEALRHYE